MCGRYALASVGMCVFALFYGASAVARPNLTWNMGLYGHSVEDDLSQSKVVGSSGTLRFQHNYSSTIQANIEPSLKLETGTSQALFTDEFRPRQQIFLNEGSIAWNPFSPFYLTVGALSQNQFKNPLLIDGGTFPAAAEKFRFVNENFLLLREK